MRPGGRYNYKDQGPAETGLGVVGKVPVSQRGRTRVWRNGPGGENDLLLKDEEGPEYLLT